MDLKTYQLVEVLLDSPRKEDMPREIQEYLYFLSPSKAVTKAGEMI